MEGSTVLKHLKSFSRICPDICACWGSIEVVVPLQKGSNGSSDNLRIIEMNMMGSWHCSVLVQRVGAVRLHCGPVQLLGVPRLRVCLKRVVVRALCKEKTRKLFLLVIWLKNAVHLDQKMRTPDASAELKKEVRRKTIEGGHLEPSVPGELPPTINLKICDMWPRLTHLPPWLPSGAWSLHFPQSHYPSRARRWSHLSASREPSQRWGKLSQV